MQVSESNDTAALAAQNASHRSLLPATATPSPLTPRNLPANRSRYGTATSRQITHVMRSCNIRFPNATLK